MNRFSAGTFPVAGRLVLCFGLLCAILAAIGGLFFFSLRSIEKLNAAERSAALGEMATLHRVEKNVGLRQVEVFRHLAATSSAEKKGHEEISAALQEANTKNLEEYGGFLENEVEKRLLADLFEARAAYNERTEELLGLSRAQRNGDAATFVLTRQIPTYERYQATVDALLRFEEAEGRGVAAATTGRIEQTRIIGDILIGLAILIALGTCVSVSKIVGALHQDKKELRMEVVKLGRAKQSLRESEARYRLLVDHSPDAIFVVCDETIVFVNPAALVLLGADSAGQLIGRNPSEMVHPAERAAVALRASELAAGQQPPTTERRLLRLDGSTVEVDSRISSFRYEGKPAIQVIARDNTERKNAAAKLDAQEKQYRLLFEDNPTPMWVYDVESLSFLAVNQAAISSYGFSREEFLTLTLRDIRPAEDVALLVESISEASAPAGYGGEWRHSKKDGSIIVAAVYSSPTVFDNKAARMALAVDRTERADAELKVRESEANLAVAQQVAGVGSWEYPYTAGGEVDHSGLIWSQEAYRLFGLSSDVPITTETFFAAVHPDDRALVTERFNAFEAGHGTYKADHRILWPDGTEHMVSNVAEKIFDSHTGKPLKVVGTVVDITERRAAEKHLREAEEKYRSIFDNALEGIFQSTPAGAIISANPTLARMLGFNSPEELIRERADLNQQIYAEPGSRQELKRLLDKTGVASDFECELTRKDGSAICVSENVRVVRDATGQILYYEGSMQDITARKTAERSLRESEQKFQQLADNITDVFWITSPDLKTMHYVSAGYEAIWGRTEASLITNPHQWIETIVDDDRERIYALFGELMGGEPRVSAEYRIARPDGTIRWIHDRGFQVRDAAGDLVRLTGIASDITERKRVEASLLGTAQRLSLATEAAHIGIWDWNIVTNDLVWDANMYALYGIEECDFSGAYNAWQNGLHPDDRQRSETEISVAVAGPGGFHTEFRVVWPNGQVRHIEAHGVVERAKDNSPARMIGVNWDITERKRAEEALTEGARRLRFLNDLGEATHSLSRPKEITAAVTRLLGTELCVSRCAYAEVEKDGNRFTVLDDYTDGCASIVGKYQLSDFGERTHSELATGSTVVLRDVDAELTPAEGADAFNAIEIKAMIACPLSKDGELVAAMAVQHRTPRQWTDGEIALTKEVVERCWSIRERARAELVVRESEEHLRLVIAGSNDGIFDHDFAADVINWSDRMFEMLGFNRQSFIPTIESFTALLHPDDRATFQDAVARQMIHGGRYDSHIRIRRQDGTYGNFLGRGEVVLDAHGTPIRIVGSLADLTSLLQTEQKLVEQGNLLNLAQDAIMVRDMDDRFEFWNHGAEVLYGWTAEEVRGHPNDDFLEYDKPLKILAERTLLETGAWSGECRHLTKGGQKVIVRSRWTLVRDEHGQPKSKLIIATDVTEQKKIEEQFLRAQRLESIGTLASGVAHDLNNILVPIMMAAPVLRGEMDPGEREKFLDIVETSAKRGADIIKQVLTFARGADGDHTLLQPIYLLEEVSKIASQTFPKSIALRTCYDENIRLLEADSTQLHQVLLNLCINARDAMPHGGQLCLGAENFDVDEHYASVTPGATPGPHVVLQVTDTGSGIPKEVLAKIFDPFFTTKGVGQGTGLGLSTVAGIVKSHGGFIQVHSKPGQTSFKIFLPARATTDVSSTLPAETLIPRGHGETILLVDDEPNIRDVAEVILKNHGYEVLVAADGTTALALFGARTGQIAVVVTDLAMPDMDGSILVRTLRRIEPGLKMIVSTGGAVDSRAAEIAALSVDGCLTKPYTRRNLLLMLSQVLRGDMQNAA